MSTKIPQIAEVIENRHLTTTSLAGRLIGYQHSYRAEVFTPQRAESP